MTQIEATVGTDLLCIDESPQEAADRVNLCIVGRDPFSPTSYAITLSVSRTAGSNGLHWIHSISLGSFKQNKKRDENGKATNEYYPPVVKPGRTIPLGWLAGAKVMKTNGRWRIIVPPNTLLSRALSESKIWKVITRSTPESSLLSGSVTQADPDANNEGAACKHIQSRGCVPMDEIDVVSRATRAFEEQEWTDLARPTGEERSSVRSRLTGLGTMLSNLTRSTSRQRSQSPEDYHVVPARLATPLRLSPRR